MTIKNFDIDFELSDLAIFRAKSMHSFANSPYLPDFVRNNWLHLLDSASDEFVQLMEMEKHNEL